jgi:predicted O-methyltransferase YrrM
MMQAVIEGQLNPAERQLLADSILKASKKPEVVVEVGTWLGGGSTVTFLRALHQNGTGHLWGIEADRNIHDRMMANLTTLAPEVMDHFTPLLGLSHQVLPLWIAERKKPFQIDVVFLDGGNRPSEQITEFELLDPYLPVGAQLFAHDARCRKGKWLVPFMSRLDNWQVQVHDLSAEGLMSARKIADQPSPDSLRIARALLDKLRREPLEVVARFTPSGVKRILFSMMPKHLAQRIAGGKK